MELWFGNWVSLYSGGSQWFSQCKNMLDFHSLVEVIWTGVLMCVDQKGQAEGKGGGVTLP